MVARGSRGSHTRSSTTGRLAPGRGARRAAVAQVLALVLTLVLALVLTGCSLGHHTSAGPSAPTTAPVRSSAHGTSLPAQPDVVRGLERVLRTRAEAVLAHDRRRFLAGLAPGRALRDQQATYLDDLAQLPLATFSYTLEPADLLREGDDYTVVVEEHVQLQGYDVAPVTTPDRFRFTPARTSGRFLVASSHDPAWQAAHHVWSQPWDSRRIEVREIPGVLGVFDAGTIARARPLLASVQRGITDTSVEVPYDWAYTVVVYALSDAGFLGSIPDLPPGDPQTFDAVAVPVVAGPQDARVVATRIVLQPAAVAAPRATRDRLIRHELTHVVVGTHDDHVPTWLREGLAEYVAAQPQPLPPTRRPLASQVVAAARVGFTEMPADAAFDETDTVVHYGLAWWACEYLAQTYGADALWTLLDRLGPAETAAATTAQARASKHGRPAPTAAQAAALELRTENGVLHQLIAINSRILARKAGKLVLATYDPSALPGPSPTTSPTPPTPSSSGSSSGSPSATPTATPAASPTG